LVSNGVASTAPQPSLGSYFDPQVEFLELGVSTANQTVWKLYGPDLDGTYGGENGTGGLDGVSPFLNIFNPVISDFRGNVLAEVTNNTTVWNASRPTGYGAVPGYQPAAFGNGADMAQSSAWRGREVDITGLYNIGLRPFDPVSGRWLTFDPSWNDGDPDGYTFCAAGDPINYFDPDGRFGKQYNQFQYNGGLAGYGLRGLANVFNTAGASSGSTYLSFQAYNNASVLNLAAGLVTPASYVNGYQSLQNRAENVMVGEYLNGSGNSWAAAQGLSSIVGDTVGYNNIYEASFNVDRQSLTSLSGADRWSRGLMGGSQLIFAGVGLRGAYNPDATFLNPGISAPSVINEPKLLTGPSQGELNAIRGNNFHNQVYDALRLPENTSKVTGNVNGKLVNTEPDLLGARTGVADIKDEISPSFDMQAKAQYNYATQNGKTFNLIVSPRTQTISIPLQNAIRQSGGIIVEFNPTTGSFQSVTLQGNRVIR
jgi:RHS repeat-associated protein